MKVYFKNLDGIRFIAAFLVLLHHAFYFKLSYSPGPAILNHMFEDAGRMGVNLFFVLSGFLISFLLFVEKDTKGSISYKNFYIRRILRIWPLYLTYGTLLVFGAPLLLEKLGAGPGVDLTTSLVNFVFLVLFAVNIQLAFFSVNPGIFEISWSVCIEEQFYLIWPIIINRFRNRLASVFITLFVVRMIFRISCVILPHYFDVDFDTLLNINYLLIFDKLDLFGGGMLIAWFYYQRDHFPEVFQRMMHPIIQFVMIVSAVLYSLSLIPLPWAVAYFGDHIIATVLFGYLLLAAIDSRSILRLESSLMRTLGKISYGIYLFHTAVCQIVLMLLKKFIASSESRLIYDVFYPVVCGVLTCLLAYLSYVYFEKYFLKSKDKFAVIKTRV